MKVGVNIKWKKKWKRNQFKMKISLKTVFSLFKLIFTFPFVWTDIETDRHKHRQTKISSRVWRKQASRQNLNVASRQIYLSFSKRSQIFRKYCSISRILRWVFVPIRELFNIFSKYKHINFLCLTVCEIFSWFSDFFYLLSTYRCPSEILSAYRRLFF